ncbi:MAG: hypothetical protein AB7Q17_05090 [Phycisphaerae bacterium]
MTRIGFAAIVALCCGALALAQTTTEPSDDPRENTPSENLALNSERPAATLSAAIARHTQIMSVRLRGGSEETTNDTSGGTATTGATGTTGTGSLSGLSGLLGGLGGLSGLGNLGSLAGLTGGGAGSGSSASSLSTLINQLVQSGGGSATSRVRTDAATASATAAPAEPAASAAKTQLTQQTATDDRPFRTRLIDGALSTFFDVFTNDFIQPVLTQAFRGFLRDALRPLFGLTDETTGDDGTNGDGTGNGDGGSQI